MCYKYFIVLAYFLKISESLNYLNGWNYINLHCRDNENSPVDWWYIYKPPSRTIPYLEKKHNFTFITPATAGRWQYSPVHLTASSLLHYTLAPLYRASYMEHLAVASYEQRGDDSEGTSAYGIIMADEMGGAWIGHSVPGLLDLNAEHPIFPRNESKNGHVLVCLSLDLLTLNRLGASLKKLNPKFLDIHIPKKMKSHLPLWNFLKPNIPILRSLSPSLFQFNTKEKTLQGVMMMRPPGDTNCLYETFAKSRRIVLDVYGHGHRKKPICKREYSVRNIDSISIKAVYSVDYIKNTTDRAGFAVSTAAHWQRSGGGPKQYWVCVNGQGQSKEALIICVNDYHVWLTFDNFKVKEPEC